MPAHARNIHVQPPLHGIVLSSCMHGQSCYISQYQFTFLQLDNYDVITRTFAEHFRDLKSTES